MAASKRLSPNQKSLLKRSLRGDYDSVLAAFEEMFPDDARIRDCGCRSIDDTVDYLHDAGYGPQDWCDVLKAAGMFGIAASCGLLIYEQPQHPIFVAASSANKPRLPCVPLGHAHPPKAEEERSPDIVPRWQNYFTRTDPFRTEEQPPDKMPLTRAQKAHLKRSIQDQDVEEVKGVFRVCFGPAEPRVQRLDASIQTPNSLVDEIQRAGFNQGEVRFVFGCSRHLGQLADGAGLARSDDPQFARSPSIAYTRRPISPSIAYTRRPIAAAAAAPEPEETLRQHLEKLADKDRAVDDHPDARECVVCAERVVAVAFGGCGHANSCVECSIQLCSSDGTKLDCPECRTEVATAGYLVVTAGYFFAS